MHKDLTGAILIDSKKTWKLMQLADEDLKKIPYKTIKNKLMVVGGDALDESEDDYLFMTASEYFKKYKDVGTIIMHMALPKQK